MKHVLARAIRGYQFLLSPWVGNQCRFYPTCSEYARLAIIEHGTLRGSWLALRRTLKCHPWHAGGIDLVPESMHRHGAKLISAETGSAGRIDVANKKPTTTNKKPDQS